MSYAARDGAQLDPEELRPRVDPAELSDDELRREVVVRFADAVTRTTPATMCDRLGISYIDWQEATQELVELGWLTPLADGSYGASIPDEYADEGAT